jgi:hypothetical protein
MKIKKTKAAGKIDSRSSLNGKIPGKNPRASAIMIFIIVISCFALGFSKETIKKYEDVFRRGKGLLGIEAEDACPEGQTFYRHDVIGLSFCYPAEWGRVRMVPKETVTRLEGLLKDFAADSGYQNSFFILFDNNRKASIRIFNDAYEGAKYTGYPSDGFVDDIGALKKSGNICDYKKDFHGWGNYEVRISEKYTDCSDGIKTAISDTQEFSNETIDGSVLESFAYKKLSNGYFDHMLLVYAYGDIIRVGKEYNSVESILPAIDLSEEDFNKEKKDFKTFVESIRTFAPQAPARNDFEAAEGEDARITLIRKYYYLLAAGKFEEAYALEFEGRKYEDFLRQYENVYAAEPYDFENAAGDEFSFLVKYQDHNEPEKEYRVRMAVIEGKLRTISAEELREEEVSFGEYTAYVAERGGSKHIILKKGEEEIIIAKGSDNDAEARAAGLGTSFSNIRFSPDGKYFLYDTSDDEFISGTLYDIENRRKIMEIPGTEKRNGFDFTPDGKYFFYCASAGSYGEDPGKVLLIPELQQVFDAAGSGSDGYMKNFCYYNQEKNAIVFTASDPIEEDLPASRETVFEVK